MTNFFGYQKPRKAGFTSSDISSDGAPCATADDDEVLEGVVVDFGDLVDVDPISMILEPGEDIRGFLRRMLVINGSLTDDDPKQADGTVLLDNDRESISDTVAESTDSAEGTESVEDVLKAMSTENEKLQDFISEAMKNIRHQP